MKSDRVGRTHARAYTSSVPEANARTVNNRRHHLPFPLSTGSSVHPPAATRPSRTRPPQLSSNLAMCITTASSRQQQQQQQPRKRREGATTRSTMRETMFYYNFSVIYHRLSTNETDLAVPSPPPSPAGGTCMHLVVVASLAEWQDVIKNGRE